MKNNNNCSKLFTLIIIISPILDSYQISGISLGLLVPLFIVPLIIFSRMKISMKWPKYFWLYFTYIILSRIFSVDSLNITSFFSLSVISFVILMGISGQYFNLKHALKIYKITALLCISFFFTQEIMFYTTGHRPMGLLPFELYGDESYNLVKSRLSSISRSASFFNEPSHFSGFLLPLLAIKLFSFKTNRIINLYALLISITILLLKSGLGIIIMLILWVIWTLYILKNLPLNKKIFIFFVLIPTFLLTSSYYINSDIGEELLSRTDEYEKVDATTSTYVRIFRGYELYDNLMLSNKVFGLNSSNKIQSLIDNSYMYILFQDDDLSFNNLQSILIYGGIFGLLLFLFHYIYLFKNNTIEGKLIAIVFLLLSFIAAIYVKPLMLLIYSLMFGFQKKYLNSKIISTI